MAVDPHRRGIAIDIRDQEMLDQLLHDDTAERRETIVAAGLQ